jgi:hypothetical protein
VVSKRKQPALLKLDLGCGQSPREGFLGVDLYSSAKYKVDLMKFPWPWKNSSVEETWSNHFFEHVPGPTRIPFMDELWRVLKPCGCKGPCPEGQNNGTKFSVPCPIPGGQAVFLFPYWSSVRAVQDPTHAWPPLCENSFMYFNKIWREQRGLGHYLGKCDFNFGYGYRYEADTLNRSDEVRAFWVKHNLNAVDDLQISMVKRGH